MARNECAAGLQMVIPGCEARTLPRSSSRANWAGQGLLGFYSEPTLREVLMSQVNAPLKARKSQKGASECGLFRASSAV